ncbi:hypothetical protein L873DRAFT_1696044 [Choiromyces venosus 120613-1]|uniref:Uncharacterized protein n=1 Tax=Choiromyces venosus 120613-1 TaxID=1336337 RepID=A0A3N4JH14_9PEZI|nr:hypothetical protein L873DRAFT_1696044 [Choiromyces venosus 120613-1]
MAQAWSQSTASLESIFAVLSDHDHPFVMVGTYALRWMGVQVLPGYTMDILIRTSQVASICQALAQTGEWLEVDESSIPVLVTLAGRKEYRSIRRFKRCDDQWYISLCSEDTYRLTVDSEKIQVPHPVNFNSVLVESEFHPNPTGRSTYWRSRPYLMTDKNIPFVWAAGGQVSFPVFIPRIPEFLDSCLNCLGGRNYMDDDSCHIPHGDMSYLARYLLLDLPHQQDKLLSKVKNTKWLAEFFADRQWRQERRMKKVMERQAKNAAHAKPGPQIPFTMKPL